MPLQSSEWSSEEHPVGTMYITMYIRIEKPVFEVVEPSPSEPKMCWIPVPRTRPTSLRSGLSAATYKLPSIIKLAAIIRLLVTGRSS